MKRAVLSAAALLLCCAVVGEGSMFGERRPLGGAGVERGGSARTAATGGTRQALQEEAHAREL